MKNGDNSPWFAHEMKVAEVFNTLSISDTELLCEETIDETVNSSYTADSKTNVSTEYSNVGEVNLEEMVDDDKSSSDTVRLNSNNNFTDDVDPTVALKVLSNLKSIRLISYAQKI